MNNLLDRVVAEPCETRTGLVVPTPLHRQRRAGCRMPALRRARAILCLGLLAAPLAAVSEPDIATIEVGNSRIHLLIEDKPFVLEPATLQNWVRDSAQIVADFYGGFPVDEAHVALRGRPGRGVRHGRAMGLAGAVVNVSLGVESSAADLNRDWVLIHELIHLAFPTVPRRHHWIEEGLAVYVESIARARAGALTEAEVWAGMLDGLPNGLPRANDRGLDFTPTWGRTYWGGALYCLLADIRLRELSDNTLSLRDALQAIVAADYDITRRAELAEVLAIADRRLGWSVLTDLYKEMGSEPGLAELDSLWRDLGIRRAGDRLEFDETAPLAGIRRALTAVAPGD